MSGRLVVKRYARALFETARDSGSLEEVKSDVAVIDKICSGAVEIRQYCLTPHRHLAKEIDFIKIAFIPYVGVLTGRLLLTAVSNGRIAAIPFLPSAMKEIEAVTGNTIEVLLESATKPDKDFLKKLEERLGKRTGKKIDLKIKIARELLGGFRIIWQNRILDMSVTGRLRKIRVLLK